MAVSHTEGGVAFMAALYFSTVSHGYRDILVVYLRTSLQLCCPFPLASLDNFYFILLSVLSDAQSPKTYLILSDGSRGHINLLNPQNFSDFKSSARVRAAYSSHASI